MVGWLVGGAALLALALSAPGAAGADAAQGPPLLHVAGNQLQTADGKAVWLQGVAICSMEWTPLGEHVLQSIGVAIDDWHVNVVRLPLNDKFWVGKGPGQTDGGESYRQLVDAAVHACAAQGVYIVLDLHEYRALREEYRPFWRAVAQRYQNQPAVFFELLNEPHDISWEVWRNGGPVTDRKKPTDAAAENTQQLVAFQAVGEQQMVEVIRRTGAQNIIIAGGLDWGYDLSGVLDGFALQDPGGNGIMYSSHVYPWKHDWQHKFLDAAAKYPLFLGEVGADAKKMPFLPADAQEDAATWVPAMLGVIQQHKLNWTAWCFHPTSTPRVILDWNYTPTPFWGVYVKQALAGQAFPLKKLR